MPAPHPPGTGPAGPLSWTERLPRTDRLFAELALARGFLRRDTLEQCAEAALSGVGSVSLADAAVGLGLLTADVSRELQDQTQSLSAALVPEVAPGHRFGEFRVIREIGRGGMGVVYEAEQESLGRRVALKVLPPLFASSEKAVVRFLREARAAGTLSHPGIVPVYTSGHADGVLFFAMELVDGRPLDQLIEEGAFAPERAARLAAGCARALAHAHEHGLIHRDVKPANILVGADDRPRLTDFGLVRETGSETITGTAAILGTPAFMAPEQARGDDVDERSDVYGLGAVLYAMLAGSTPYAHRSGAAILALVLTEPPASLRALRPSLPAPLFAIVERAMARDTSERYQSAASLADDLERYLRGEALVPTPGRPLLQRVLSCARRRSVAMSAGAVAAGVALAVLGYALLGPSARPPRAVPQRLTQVTRMTGRQLHPSLSPDGQMVAFTSHASGNWDVWLKKIEKGAPAVNLTPDSPEYDGQPAISPDGTQVAFHSGRDGGGLFAVRLDGGGLRRLAASGFHPAWSPDGRFLAYSSLAVWGPTRRDQLAEIWVMELATGRTERVHAGDAAQPSWSPDGSHLVFWAQEKGTEHGNLFTIPARGGESTRLTSGPFGDWTPVWAPDGHQVFFTSNRGGARGIWRVAVDPASGAPLGEPEPLTIGALGESLYLSVSADGTRLAFVSWNLVESLKVLALDPARGTTTGVPRRVEHESTKVRFPVPSPDGSRLLYVRLDPNEDLILADGAGEHPLVADQHRDRSPRWSPDGKRIAFHSDRAGAMDVWVLDADGGGLRQVTHSPGASCVFPVWSPDGVRIACSEDSGRTLLVRADRDAQAQVPERLPPVPDSRQPFTAYSWSADGRTIAGWSNGILLYDLAARSYTRLTDFGSFPLWLGSGPWIAFAHDKDFHVVNSATKETRLLLSEKPDEINRYAGVTADGRALYYSSIISDGQVWVVDVASQ